MILADGSMMKYMILPIFQQFIYIYERITSELYELYLSFSRDISIPDLKLGSIHIGKSQFFFFELIKLIPGKYGQLIQPWPVNPVNIQLQIKNK